MQLNLDHGSSGRSMQGSLKGSWFLGKVPAVENCFSVCQAVCCSDHIHCCPHGTSCNLPAQTCDNTTASVPQFRKVPMFPWQGPRLGDVVCDATHRCPAMTTCCRNKVGDWSCCPLSQVNTCGHFLSRCLSTNQPYQRSSRLKREMAATSALPVRLQNSSRHQHCVLLC